MEKANVSLDWEFLCSSGRGPVQPPEAFIYPDNVITEFFS
jgi:hypothetical protein